MPEGYGGWAAALQEDICVGWSIKGEGCEICCRHSVAQHLLQLLGLRFVLLWLSREGTPSDFLKVGCILLSTCFCNGRWVLAIMNVVYQFVSAYVS